MSTKEEFLKEIFNDKNDDDLDFFEADMSKEAIEFYKKFFNRYFNDGVMNSCYSGDCMNSLGWTFDSENKVGKFYSKRSYTKGFARGDIELFYKFRKGYHSLANFIVLPHKLNLWRGEVRVGGNDNTGKGSCDYFDIFLNIIRKCFLGKDMMPEEENYTKPYKYWLDSYGLGNSGWVNFIESNYLLPFVNKDYEVKDIFAPPNWYIDNNCNALVGTYHDFGWSLPGCKRVTETIFESIQPKDKAINFAHNSIWIWEQRALALETISNEKKEL